MLGPNGSGKTTLLRIIAKLLKESSGSLEFAEASNDLRPTTFYLPAEDRGLYARLSIKQNLLFFTALFGYRREVVEEEIKLFINNYCQEDFFGKSYQQLSAGQKRLAILFLAFFIDCRLLLLDEPWRNLDPLLAEKLATDLISKKLNKQTTVIIATQRIELVEKHARRFAVLDKGKMLGQGEIAQISREQAAADTDFLKKYYRSLLAGAK